MTDQPEQSGPPAEDELPGAIEKSPDPERIRERRAQLTGWRLKLYDYRVVPAEIPSEFNEPLDQLIERLSTDDALTAATILEEAQAISAEATSRIDSAERRATTLQGTVAIAASLVVAGAGLLLDPSKVTDRDWRIVLLIVLAAVLGCLIGCAWRALAVTGRMFEFEQPGPERIHLRAKASGVNAQTFRAAELLRAAGVSSEVGAVKVGLLRSSAWWLRAALAVLAAFIVAVSVYAATASDSPTAPADGPGQVEIVTGHGHGSFGPQRGITAHGERARPPSTQLYVRATRCWT
jgi:hypothetical protein